MRDINSIKKAIDSVNASNWDAKTKKAMLKSLDDELENTRIEKSYEGAPAQSVEFEYVMAQNLIRKSSAPEDLKERELDSLDDIYGPLLEESQARKDMIQKMVQQEPLIRLIKSTGQLIKSGHIAAKDGYDLISAALSDSEYRFAH